MNTVISTNKVLIQFFILALLSLSLTIPALTFGQNEDSEDSDNPLNKENNYTDTLTSGAYRIFRDYSSEINQYAGTHQGMDESVGLNFVKVSKEDTLTLGSVTFTNSYDGYDDPQRELDNIEVKFSKNRFLLQENSSSGESSIEFSVQHDTLAVSPELIRQLERAADNPKDSVKDFKAPCYLLSRMEFTDMNACRICRLYDIQALIDSSEWDQAEVAIDSLKMSADSSSDRFIKTKCDKIKAQIANHKKETLPLQLIDAKKIGVLIDPPVYPPLDTPTIFWQDTLLCVIQGDNTQKKLKMRTFNPASSKWGPVVPARIPKCSMKGYIDVHPCYYCENEEHYWHSVLALPGEDNSCDLCDCFTDERPLVSIPEDSIFLFKKDGFDSVAVAKSGGSCIAGQGGYVFGEDGKLYTHDMKTSWDVQMKNLVNSSTGNFVEDKSISAEYPVVVSATQNLIAYAIKRDENSKIELWVARIKYLK